MTNAEVLTLLRRFALDEFVRCVGGCGRRSSSGANCRCEAIAFRAAIPALIAALEIAEQDREALWDALDILGPCDDDSQPAWCCAHRQKNCDVSRLRSKFNARLRSETKKRGGG